MKNIFIVCSIAVLLCGCPVPQSQNTPNKEIQLKDSTTGRDYWIYIPSTYDPSVPIPLVVSCHGTVPFDVSQHHIKEWKMLAEKNNCMVVCPWLDGTDGIFGNGNVNSMKHSDKIIMSIFSDISKKYNIDRNNVMITGFSGGGFPTYWTGLAHPDVFTVIVARNCNFNRNSVDGNYPESAKNTQIMIYWGSHDPATIVIQSRDAIKYFMSRGFNNVETAIIPNSGHDRHPEVAMGFFTSNKK